MKNPMVTLRTLLGSFILLTAGIGVLFASTNGFRAYTSETARRIRVSENPLAVPSVPLEIAEGGYTSFKELRGRWLLIDFFYSRCMTFCTIQGTDFMQMQYQMADPIAADKVVLLNISFDLVHDDLAALRKYQLVHGKHGTGWIAARALNQKDLATLMNAFGVVAVPDKEDGFVHNSAIAIVNPSGNLVAIMDWDNPRGAVDYVMKRLEP